MRGFAGVHLHATDPAAEIPPRHLISARTSRATPYLYSAAEVAALMAATSRLSSRLRAAAYRTLIGLLASTGMRVGPVDDDLPGHHAVMEVITNTPPRTAQTSEP